MQTQSILVMENTLRVYGLIFIKIATLMGDSPKETTSSGYFDRSQVDGECRIGFSTSKGDNSLTL